MPQNSHTLTHKNELKQRSCVLNWTDADSDKLGDFWCPAAYENILNA
jgi:hypothetical protein